MAPRDTRTGGVLENIILPALSMGGYSFDKQVMIGTRPGGGAHKIDVLAQDSKGLSYFAEVAAGRWYGRAESPFRAYMSVRHHEAEPGKIPYSLPGLGRDGVETEGLLPGRRVERVHQRRALGESYRTRTLRREGQFRKAVVALVRRAPAPRGQ